MTSLTVEDRLYHTPFKVHENHAHLEVLEPDKCVGCMDKQCAICCPAKCYTIDDSGRAQVAWEGCVECGTCRIVCNEFGNIRWDYPTGGFGVSYKRG